MTAPVMVALKMGNDMARALLEEESAIVPHPSVEFGSPAMKLGVTILNAYAAIYAKPDEHLPAAWWPTYDPSSIGSLSFLEEAIGTPSLPIVANNARYYDALPESSLYDTSKRTRIGAFLRQAEGR
jgi:hypothetical protein